MSSERPAEPGEQCDCGRPAVVVYITERFGEVPYCGRPGVAVEVDEQEPADR